MKSRLSKSEQNRADATSLLFELEEEAMLQIRPLETRVKDESAPKVEPKLSQSKVIPDYSSNVVQTSAKPSSNHSSNVVQTSAKPSSAPLDAMDSSGAYIVQTSFESRPKPSSDYSSNVVQTSAKPSSDFEFDSLSPIQQRLLLFLSEHGQQTRSEISSALNGAMLAERLECGLEGVRTAVKRLVANNLLNVVSVKSGKSGWTKYQLPEHVFQALLKHQTWFKPSSNVVQTSAKPSPKSSSESSSNLSSSSREVLFKESSTTPQTVADELGLLNLTELREFGITIETFKRAVQLHPVVTIEALSDLAFRLVELFKNPKERAKIQNARGFVIKLVEQLNHGITPLITSRPLRTVSCANTRKQR